MMRVSGEVFEAFVREAIGDLPGLLKDRLDNVEIIVDEGTPGSRPLLGLYQGVPLPDRGVNYSGALPDRITIFKNAIERDCGSEAEVREAVRATVVHELAHYFGFSEERIRDLGYS